MGRTGTEEFKAAPSSQPAAVFTSVVPVDHVADDPESGTFGLADASARSIADGRECVLHPVRSARCRGSGVRAWPLGDASSHLRVWGLLR